MNVALAAVMAITFYLGVFAVQIIQVLRASKPVAGKAQNSRQNHLQVSATVLALMAMTAHFVTASNQLFTDRGMDFSLMPVSVLILLVINLIVVVGSLRQPLHNLFLLLFPASIMVIFASLVIGGETAEIKAITPGLGIHILLSIVAYSLMTIAALEALFLAYQNHQLHQHHTSGLGHILPPLQTLESLLFSLLVAGFVSLTLALLTGIVFVEDFMAQHLAHKTVFSVVAWLVYAILLWGRFKLGWRGRTATLWTLGGFFALMLAFWGSKFVLEFLLTTNGP